MSPTTAKTTNLPWCTLLTKLCPVRVRVESVSMMFERIDDFPEDQKQLPPSCTVAKLGQTSEFDSERATCAYVFLSTSITITTSLPSSLSAEHRGSAQFIWVGPMMPVDIMGTHERKDMRTVHGNIKGEHSVGVRTSTGSSVPNLGRTKWHT